MTIEPRFSILPFPQRFDGTRLTLHMLVVPRLGPAWNGDPRAPMIENFPAAGDTAAAFADADLRLRVMLIDGLDRFPVNDPVDFSTPLPAASGVAPLARDLYEELVAPKPGRFVLDPGAPRLAETAKPQIFIQKYLPESYREAFLFSGPQTKDAKTDDSYQCAVRKGNGPNPAFVSTPDTVSWGQIYAYCLRHHQLARRLGLIRQASFRIGPGMLADGGYLWVDLNGGDYAAQSATDFTFVARYAARIPKLEAGTARPLFAAVLFPVLFDDPAQAGAPPAPGNYDSVFLEAAEYDDGFAKVVHGTQPVSQNLLQEEPDGFSPLTDIGIRLGWDDEQILIWQNRQLKEDPTVLKVGGIPQRLDAPLGVFAYRVDARKTGTATWRTLVRVRSHQPLTLGPVSLGDPPEALFEGELGVEVHPQQLDGDQANGQFWLPSYFTQWNGASLVLPDEVAAKLYQTEQAVGASASLGRLYEPVGLGAISLRYGISYDFRVRLMDPTGGGPGPTQEAVHEALAPVTQVLFRRHVVPEPVRVADLPKFPEEDLDTPFVGNVLTVGRPLLNYPAVAFTGKYADPLPLLQAASDAAVGKDSFGIPDPDVTALQIDVEVRALRMDNQGSLNGREAWTLLYTTRRAFPAPFDMARAIPLSFVDAPVLRFGNPGDLGLGVTEAEIDALDELVLPTARDIRLTLRGMATPDPGYFGGDAHIGKPVQVHLRRESATENDLFADTAPSSMLRGIYLQPDPVELPGAGLGGPHFLFQSTTGGVPSIVQRLAQEVRVENKGLTLVGKKGERVVFACSRRIRHTLSPDNSSITFAGKDDLINHWIVALTLQLDRDWTWDGLQEVGFEIFRSKRFKADAEIDDNGGRPVGDWELVRTASLQSLDDPSRGYTRLIFLDAVEPKSGLAQAADPTETRFPDVIELEYRVEPRFRAAPAPPSDPAATISLELPVTTPPAQVPRIVSAGLALSKYRRNERYSATEPRRRFLWLEFEEPPRDPNDGYFIRLLGYAPDPVLSDGSVDTYIPPEEPALPIDPEFVRAIGPGQGDDQAGRAAMQPLEPAGNSARHFKVPLPPGLVADSAELFGFFTYELRAGHTDIWSTAQGRFGRPLRATGVQHPAPTLFCTCYRDPDRLLVEATRARAVLHGKDVTAKPPHTEIWALLYAQVHQADGKDFRNILLEDRLLRRPVKANSAFGLHQFDDGGPVLAQWSNGEIETMLADLGLSRTSSLSVLCVEMLPTITSSREGLRTQTVLMDDLKVAVGGTRTGVGGEGAPSGQERGAPLSDALGHVRILRTSPLTEVPSIC